MNFHSASRIVALWSFFLVQAYGQDSAPPTSSSIGSIRGSLLTQDGKAASRYIVDVLGTSPSATRRNRVQTDEHGLFEFSNLKPGNYVVAPYLEDVDSRYPAGTSSFYDPDPVRVQLTDLEPNRSITIHLGLPNRILSGTVISNFDKSPVLATIQIEIPSAVHRFIRFSSRADGAFRVLIPANTQLVVKTTAPGYAADSQILGPVAEDVDPELTIKLNPARP